MSQNAFIGSRPQAFNVIKEVDLDSDLQEWDYRSAGPDPER